MTASVRLRALLAASLLLSAPAFAADPPVTNSVVLSTNTDGSAKAWAPTVAPICYDSTNNVWHYNSTGSPCPGGGSGGGGGASTALAGAYADGALVTLGFTTDSSYSGTGAGSLIAINKAQNAWLASILGIAAGTSGLSASGKTPVASTFSATGTSAAFTPLAGRPFNIAVWGATTAPGASLAGTVYLARSTDSGTTYLPVTASGTQLESFTANASDSWTEAQTGVTYELICTAWTATINYRISQ